MKNGKFYSKTLENESYETSENCLIIDLRNIIDRLEVLEEAVIKIIENEHISKELKEHLK